MAAAAVKVPIPATDIRSPGTQATQQGQLAQPSGPMVVHRVVYRTLGEPYQGWRELLIMAFRKLVPEENTTDGRRYNTGKVAAIVMKTQNRESFMVAARFDINHNSGANVDRYTRVVEALIRGTRAQFKRCEITGGPEPYASGQIKALCGIKIAITIKTLPQAML